jgi:uncharacterized protein YjbJ (UPF0337 family)
MGEFSKKTKGRLEQAIGGLTGNKRLQKEGQADERAGRVEGAVTDVKHAVKSAKHALDEVSK